MTESKSDALFLFWPYGRKGDTMEKELTLIKDDETWPVYLNEYNFKVRAYREGIYDFLHEPLRRVGIFNELLSDEDFGKYGFVCNALLETAERQLKAFCSLLEKHFGEICVDTPRRNQIGYDGLPIGIFVKPSNGKAPESKPLQEDDRGLDG